MPKFLEGAMQGLHPVAAVPESSFAKADRRSARDPGAGRCAVLRGAPLLLVNVERRPSTGEYVADGRLDLWRLQLRPIAMSAVAAVGPLEPGELEDHLAVRAGDPLGNAVQRRGPGLLRGIRVDVDVLPVGVRDPGHRGAFAGRG